MERAGCLPPIVIWNSLLNLLTGSPDEGGIDVGVEVFTIMRRADVQVNQATFSALAAIRKAMEKAVRGSAPPQIQECFSSVCAISVS